MSSSREKSLRNSRMSKISKGTRRCTWPWNLRTHRSPSLARDGRIQKSIMSKQGQTPLELASKITMFLPLASIMVGLACSGAPFSTRRREQVEPWKGVDRKWYDNVSKNLAIVSVLITVAFSATFNLPGGYDSSNGKATLHGQLMFKIFMFSDSMAITFSLVSTILLILVRAVDAPESWLIFVSGILNLWLAIVFMNTAFTVAAISAGLGQQIAYLALYTFYSPIVGILFFYSPVMKLMVVLIKSTMRVGHRLNPYTAHRLIAQHKYVLSLAGLLVVALLSSLWGILWVGIFHRCRFC